MEIQKKTIEPAIPQKRLFDDANHRELNAFRSITTVSKYPPPKLRSGVQVVQNFPSGCGIPQDSIGNQENLKPLKSFNDGLSDDFKYFLDNKIKSFKPPESVRNTPFGSRPEGKVKFWDPTCLEKGAHARKPKDTTTAVTRRILLKKLDNKESNHGKMTSHGKDKEVGFQPMENLLSSESTTFQKKTTELALTRKEPINNANECESESFRKPTGMVSTNPLPKIKTGVQVVRDFPPGCGIPQDSFRSNEHLKPFTSSNNMLMDDLKYFVDNKIKSFNPPDCRRNNSNDSRPAGKVKFLDPLCLKKCDARKPNDMESRNNPSFGSRSARKVKFWDPTCSMEGDAQKVSDTTTVVSEKESVRRVKIKQMITLFDVVYEELLHENRLKEKGERIANWRVPTEVANIVKQKLKLMEPDKLLGSIYGIQVGDTFRYRSQLQMVGLHCQPQKGIDYTKIDGKNLAISIVDSHRYSNESGSCDMMIYCGQGGLGFLGRKLPPEDQKLARGNRALKNSLDEKTPVRVIRKVEGDGKNDVFVYYGLYTVNNYTQERSAEGNMVFKFQLQRIPGQPQLHTMFNACR